ncbi:hypothetical protein CRX42_24910 [Pseudomonas jessenii]|uniref:Uncharacterized protein n=1 Tax=Pseudomonas jessenii TaxID=77298 RepID=A0A2W0EI18_PSEJE|nr:hypothetical protein CRX42_24910 [Pseudomonas jessenii]
MSQKNTMSKLPNGIRVISYEHGSFPLRVRPMHFLMSGRHCSQVRSATMNDLSSIAFDQVDCHPMTAGIQA